MTIYLPNNIGCKFTLGSKIYKKVNGKKVYMIVYSIYYHGYKNKETHIKFKGKQITKTKKHENR